ncbi:DMT family transporter [Amorphus orientalis]|uniref:Small multidrug resistance pump n=1 Tax=Amorphus orientalis TaxID=649198 RepID=A0AAE4AVQ7_9HYPH|nr:multidrug efflux SMR transporter [Amorphus orientalis]MDQ0316919.1 small multidrug resistance pump [Amorphus orientalis]
MTYVYLMIAIVMEVVATSALKETHGFTRLGPSIVTVIGYALSFYFLAQPLKTLPVGVVYAIWSGAGIILIAMIGYFVFRQTLDAGAIVGLALIISGVLVINLFSNTLPH